MTPIYLHVRQSMAETGKMGRSECRASTYGDVLLSVQGFQLGPHANERLAELVLGRGCEEAKGSVRQLHKRAQDASGQPDARISTKRGK